MELTHELSIEVQRIGCDICFKLMKETKMTATEYVNKMKDQEKTIQKLKKKARENAIKFE